MIVDEVRALEPSRFDWLLHALEKMEIDEKNRTVTINRGRARLGKDNPYYEQIVARYGKERAEAIGHVEAFELCEYGRQPSQAELWELFPK